MKSTRLVVAALALAAQVGAMQEWRYAMPETGMMPSYGKMEFVTRMGERHGGSDMSMQSYGISLPFSDPRRTEWNHRAINVELNLGMDVFNTGGSLDLENDVFYTLALPVTFIRSFANGNRLMYGLSPSLATDGDSISKGTDCSLFALYSVKKSDTFSYTVGLGTSPRFGSYSVVPVLGFEWTPNEYWTVAMKGYKLSAMYKVNDRLSVGPFAAGHGGTWSAETERGSRVFRVRSLIVGAELEYDFSQPGQTKRVITAAVGSTVTTNAQFCDRTADKDAYESHHYKPGLYVSAGVDFRF